MIVDLRYHIASLVAVFLALGIGILVGGIMLSNDAIVKQQKQITDKLEAQLEHLRQKNEVVQAQASSLQMENSMQKQFEKEVLPLLVGGSLEGYRVAIIETNSYGFPDDLIETLNVAGAKVQSITTVINGFNGTVSKKVLESRLGWNNLTEEQLTTRLAVETGKNILLKDNQNLLEFLLESGLIKMSGKYGVPVDGVIIIGGSQERQMARPELVDLPLIDYFLSQKVNVYGVEDSGVSYSYMKEYQKKRISTVDNIDTVPGQVALVLAMTGKPGHYGIKPTAQKLLPVLPEAKGAKGASE